MDRIDSKSKAYLLGLIVAKRRKENRVTLGFEDRAFLKSISKELLSFLPIEIESSKNKIDITFNSKEFLEQLNNFSIKSLDERFINSFVRGFFDIRGEIKSLKAYICSKQKRLLDEIYNIYEIPAILKSEKLIYKDALMLDFLANIYDEVDIYPSKNYKRYQKICHLSGKGSFDFIKLSDEAVAPFKSRASDSGFDLTLLKKVKQIGEVELYSTGIAVKPAYGYYFDLVPRSSIIKSGYILANSIGIIDRTYRGEILVPLIKIDKSTPALQLPSRVIQLIPRQIIHFRFEEKSLLDSTHRDVNGFGSSGI